MPVICSPIFPQIEEESETGISQYFAEFAFPLSDFQKHAIKAIVEGHHVLVCAPTGSGKTLPAEFAIRHFINNHSSDKHSPVIHRSPTLVPHYGLLPNQGKRVIYTSPIKALSNQKYHEFSKKFAPFGITVGLCTGDIKTNPTADLLIMTAEILNNRLFQLQSSDKADTTYQLSQSSLSFTMDLETELAAVIMDEVHYINDESRGHVWEQTILTLPPQVQMIMLSATLDGPEKFAEWIETIPERGTSIGIGRFPRETTTEFRMANETTRQNTNKNTNACVPCKKVYLAQTATRIVPLSHYAYFPPAPLAITKAVKSTPLEPMVKQQTNHLITMQTAYNVFQPNGYKTATQLCTLWQDNISGHVSRKHILNNLATFMKGSDDPDIDNTMLPAIVFTFSRKQVEESAQDMTANILAFDSKIPYTAAHECEQILRRLPNWREYAELPEYHSLVRLLEKGVGIHHSGMIPILREIVELRISEKKIFMLFATESFAIGLDCPIRTAVFTGVTKFDGSGDRFLYAHEYTQMAGRAGRRGIDTVGHVIHLPLLYRRGIPTELEYKEILSNKPQTLVSKFHIDYKMILSLLKKGVSADFHLFAEKSMSKNTIVKEVRFQEFELDKLRQECEHLQGCLKTIRTPLDTCKSYNVLLEQYRTSTNKKRKEIERKIAAIKDQHKYIGEDIRLLAKVETLESSIQKKDREISATNSYLKRQTDLVCRILVELGALERVTDQKRELDQSTYTLSHPLGIIAAQFAEVHPYPLAELILNNNWFNGWTAKQLVGLLSVFVDIRLPEHQREIEPQCLDPVVKRAMTALQKSYDDIRQLELEYECYTGIRYEGVLCFDMADAMMNWCDLGRTPDSKRKVFDDSTEKRSMSFVDRMTEEDGDGDGDGGEDSNTHKCKQYLQDLVAGSVSSGDFAKACMKLSATAKEMIAMCESVMPFVTGSGPTELAHTLTQIDAMLLKHIATTQSLYL